MTSIFRQHGSEIRCFAHTLQLAVLKTQDLCTSDTKEHITICRMVAKQLRLHVIGAQVAKSGRKLKKIRLECQTRWSSLFLMVCFKHFCLLTTIINCFIF